MNPSGDTSDPRNPRKRGPLGDLRSAAGGWEKEIRLALERIYEFGPEPWPRTLALRGGHIAVPTPETELESRRAAEAASLEAKRAFAALSDETRREIEQAARVDWTKSVDIDRSGAKAFAARVEYLRGLGLDVHARREDAIEQGIHWLAEQGIDIEDLNRPQTEGPSL
jgi:hypothetical protein